MLYRIQASGDTRIPRGAAEPPKAVARGVLSSVMRATNDDPMMLLTSLPVNGSFESMWRIVEGYLTRWRIEETIRFVKQAYGFENIRVLSYRGIRNMASIVLATAYFASVWLGRHVKREVLAEHLKTLSQRLGKVPEFANYAIADGVKRAFTRFEKWCRKIIDPEPEPTENELLEFLQLGRPTRHSGMVI